MGVLILAIDTVACLAAGNCVVMTKTVYQTFIGMAVLGAIFMLVLVLISMFTPALVFLKAKFTKASLIFSVNRGQQGQFLIAKNKHQGIMDVKKVGPFIITENSHILETKSKLPFYFAFGEFAATVPLEFAKIIQYLKDKTKKMVNIEDLGALVGMEFDDVDKAWKTKQFPTAKDKDDNEITEVLITPYKTIKLHDMAYMFPFNITPALIESKTQHMIGIKMKMFNSMNMQFVMMFIMILMGATLAAVIAFKFLKTGDVTGVGETRTIIERVVQVSGVQNLTG